MKTNSLTFRLCVALSLVLYSGCIPPSSRSVPVNSEEVAPPAIGHQSNIAQRVSNGRRISRNGQQISEEEAIAIANEDAAKGSQSLGTFRVCACELARLWIIVYDGGGSEYYIDKESGDILSVQRLPQGDAANAVSGEPSSVINETEAVEIARRHFADFLASYGDDREHVAEYDVVACELANAWRVFFEYRMKPGESLATMPNTNPPNYVIDKRTGEIIYTTHQLAR